MRSQKPRILIQWDGQDLAFCHQKLKIAMNRYISEKGEHGVRGSKTELRQSLADYLNLSPEAIKNYVQGYNGPMDISTVKKIAEFLGVEWIELMREVSPMTEQKYVSTEQVLEEKRNGLSNQQWQHDFGFVSDYDKICAWKAVREVYQAMRRFVSYFGFEFDIPLYLKDKRADLVISDYFKCWEVMHKNMLDIPEQTYGILEDFLYELGLWIYGLPGAEYEDGVRIKEPEPCMLYYFSDLEKVGVVDREADEMEISEYTERITKRLIESFYSRIGDILQNYRPQEVSCEEEN